MATGKKYYFDTAIFIYALENGREDARELITQALQEGTVGTSVVTIMEYCTGCYKHERRDIAERFRSFLSKYAFEIQQVDESVALEAAEIKASFPAFRQMDALQIASAKIAGADVFYTNDKQLLKYRDDGIQIVSM